MTKTAIYTRVSTTDQETDGYGLDAQLAKCEAMAIVKDFEIVATLSDSMSGTKDQTERDGLATLLEMASNKEIDCVIIAGLDRLGRNTKLVLSIVETLETNGVDLISCKESLDTSNPSGRFVLRMFASLAELERDSIIERTTSGRNARGKIDGEKGGSIPWGYTRIVTESVVVVNEITAAHVRTMFQLRDSGETLQRIANHFNGLAIKTARGKIWHTTSVQVIMKNRNKYEGGLRGASQENWPKIL